MSPEQEKQVRERYCSEATKSLAEDMGVPVSTLEKLARAMGLKKSEERIRQAGMETGRKNSERLKGRKQAEGQKGDRPWRFKKGQRAFSGELEEKRVKAIRDSAWEERKRVIRGEERKTGWKMADYAKRFGKKEKKN